MQLVIDTNIWVRALIEEEYDEWCDYALISFMQKRDHQLVLDDKREIQGEYEDNVKASRKYQRLMLRLGTEQRLTYTSSHLPNKHIKKLDELKFHEPEDRVFVGSAYHTDGKIITEDSDYGVHGEEEKKAVYEYMKQEMNLQVFTAKQAVETIL